MHIALGQIQELDAELATFARQLGVTSVQFNTPALPDDAGYWKYDDLARMRDHCEELGLRLEALENVPMHFMTDFLVGTARAEEALGNYCRTIQNMGRAGITLLGYHFMPTFVWRTEVAAPGRGGALVTAFAADRMKVGNKVNYPQTDCSTPIDAEHMWANYQRFLTTVLPVAEASGVGLALHPDDPPLRAIGRVSRLFWCVDGLQRAYELSAGSPAWGLDLCLGTVSEMADVDSVSHAIEYFGPLGRIFYVHFRDVQGRVPAFQECFLGEGNYDPVDVMALLHDCGFDGFILDDHVPRVIGDQGRFSYRAHAHAIGYLQGLLASADTRRGQTTCA